MGIKFTNSWGQVTDNTAQLADIANQVNELENTGVDTTARADIAIVEENIFEICNDFRFICVSDLHKDQEIGEISGIQLGGISSAERLLKLVDDLNKENDIKKVDLVFILGDLSKNNETTDDGVLWVKENVVDRLNMPVYCVHGNHDNYPDADWEALFGYAKNFVVEFGDYVFLLYDTFGTIATDPDWSTFKDIDLEDLEAKLELYKDKKMFFMSHWIGADGGNPITANHQAALELMATYSNLVCCIQGHDHGFYQDNWYGVRIVRDGCYSDSWTEQPVWGYRHFEVINDALYTEKILTDFDYGDYEQAYARSDRFWLVGTEQTVPDYARDSDFYNRGKYSGDTLNLHKALDEKTRLLFEVKDSIESNDYVATEGTSVTFTNSYGYPVDIVIKGSSTVSAAGTFESPATIVHACDDKVLSLSINSVVTTIGLKDSLKSVPSVADEIREGKLYRRVAVRVFDGTEGWARISGTHDTYSKFWVGGIGHKYIGITTDDSINVVCDKLTAVDDGSYALDANGECISVGSEGTCHIKIEKSRLASDDATGFNAYLAANNITVVVPSVPYVTDEFEPLKTSTVSNTITTSNTNKPTISVQPPDNIISLIDSILNKHVLPQIDYSEIHRANCMKAIGKQFGYFFAETWGRPNSTGTLGDADTGQTWTNVNANGTISDFKLINEGAAAACRIYTDIGASDLEYSAELLKRGSGEFCIMFRMQDINNYLRFQMLSLNQLTYFQVVASGNPSSSVDIGHVPQNGVYTVKAKGNDISLYLNNTTLLYSTTEATHASDTKIGITAGKNAGIVVGCLNAKYNN
jgi:predicted phosphodiesterase